MARWRRRRADAPITVRFGDDAVLHFRLIQPDDREQLRRGFEHLTEPSRYRRFLRAVDELSESDLDYFTKVVKAAGIKTARGPSSARPQRAGRAGRAAA